MKKILPLFLGLFIIAAVLFNFRNTLSQPSTIQKPVDEFGEMHRDNWREALLEFGDEDDTLDSLDYVPDFLR